jgi:ornithine cyclodeaminase/alanine dehydrogenase-like protein (mu-crystallin family)
MSNGVGSYTLDMQEIPSETVARARVTVDSRSAAQVESGDIANPLKKNLISESQIAEIGEVILGQQPGRNSPNQITLFKSVGVAVQDAMAAQLAVSNARKLGLGMQVEW